MQQTKRQELADRKVVFVPADHLGVLELQFLGVITGVGAKRKSKLEFNRFARLMHDLKFIPGEAGWIQGISYGLNTLGERGLFVTLEVPTRTDVIVPAEEQI